MEFEFRRDVTGELQAHFSMGCEAIAAWLTEEVGRRVTVLPEIFKAIDQLQAGERWEYLHEGVEFNLRLGRNEAEVCDSRIDFGADDMAEGDAGMAEDLDFYDEEQRACCGLDDFRDMLIEWQDFVSSR